MKGRKDEEDVEFIAFRWYVPECGYVWRDDMKAEELLGGKGDPPFLIVENPNTRSHARQLPFDEPGNEQMPLFEEFANLGPSQEAIKQFADANGWMGIGSSVRPPGNKVTLKIGESLGQWRQEILLMKRAVALWKCTQWEGIDSSVRVEWKSNHCVVVDVTPGNANDKPRKHMARIVIHREEYPEVFSLFQRNTPLVPVRVALALVINRKLRDMASPGLLIDRRTGLQGFVRPRHFLGAMWTQLYQAIQEWRQIRPCKYCRALMDVTGGRSTKHAHARCVLRHKMSRYRLKLAKRKKASH